MLQYYDGYSLKVRTLCYEFLLSNFTEKGTNGVVLVGGIVDGSLRIQRASDNFRQSITIITRWIDSRLHVSHGGLGWSDRNGQTSVFLCFWVCSINSSGRCSAEKCPLFYFSTSIASAILYSSYTIYGSHVFDRRRQYFFCPRALSGDIQTPAICTTPLITRHYFSCVRQDTDNRNSDNFLLFGNIITSAWAPTHDDKIVRAARR